MEITDLRIIPNRKTNTKVVAEAQITISNTIMIRGVKVILGKEGLFVSMPTVPSSFKKYYNVISILKIDFRDKLESLVLAEYLRKTE